METSQGKTIAAIEIIYERHAALMYGCICKLIPQKEAADKILVEAFIDLYSRKDEYNYNPQDSIWFLKHAMSAAFHFIKQGSMAKEFPTKVNQQILEIKNTKYIPTKNKQHVFV
jgi:hypothetical protein